MRIFGVDQVAVFRGSVVDDEHAAQAFEAAVGKVAQPIVAMIIAGVIQRKAKVHFIRGHEEIVADHDEQVHGIGQELFVRLVDGVADVSPGADTSSVAIQPFRKGLAATTPLILGEFAFPTGIFHFAMNGLPVLDGEEIDVFAAHGPDMPIADAEVEHVDHDLRRVQLGKGFVPLRRLAQQAWPVGIELSVRLGQLQAPGVIGPPARVPWKRPVLSSGLLVELLK